MANFSYLGVVLDENLSWKDHVDYVSSKVITRLWLFSRIRSCLTLETSKQIYTSLLQPLFDYADVAWGEISGLLNELHRLQNRAARIILWKNTSNDTFCLLNWLNPTFRRKMHKCILVFKSLNNLEQGMRICTVMQLGEATTCTPQSLNVTWAKSTFCRDYLFQLVTELCQKCHVCK